MPRATKAKEISLKLGNQIGAGARIFGRLKDAGVDVVASCAYQIADEAHFTIVPDDAAAAERVLRERGLEPTSQDVLLVEMANELGAFAQVLQEIAKLRVNVRSAYASSTATRALAVLKTDDDERIMAELNEIAPAADSAAAPPDPPRS